MDEEDNKLPIEPVPESEYGKKHKQEEEYFRKEEEEKIKRLHEKLTVQAAAGNKTKTLATLTNKDRLRLAEAVFALLIALALTWLVVSVKSGPIAKYAELILAWIWLYLPVLFIWTRKEGLKDFAIARLNLLRGLAWFLLALIAIFPIFYLASYFFAVKVLDCRFVLTIPKNFSGLAISQLLLISLPEEWFFRGYLQARFNQVLGKPWKFLSAQIGPGLFLTAILFSLAHFSLNPSPERLLVFFPGLVFGWLREKTDSILAPMLFHFACNLTFIIFQVSLLK